MNPAVETIVNLSMTPLNGESQPHVLDEVHAFLGRFVAYPSEHAHVAHTLWIAHTHFMDLWESTPRLAFLSPEPGSGKTRALEITETLVPRPIEAINATVAYMFRKISDPKGLPTILYDEIDTLFGPRAKENEELRGVINAGHRKGASAGKCVVRGKTIETEEFPAYCAVAMAGLGNLPDTIMSRSIVVKMRRRAPAETVEPYRRKLHAPDGYKIRDRLAKWAEDIGKTLDTTPTMPEGITDRNADVWESLLSVAEAVGGGWPSLARVSAVSLVSLSADDKGSLGLRLLTDLRTVFGNSKCLFTADILPALLNIEEGPWADLKGKPLDAHRLAKLLKPYGIESKQIRINKVSQKGYTTEALMDAWLRYLPGEKKQIEKAPPLPAKSETSETTETSNGASQEPEEVDLDVN